MVRALLDTHAFRWWAMGGTRVGDRARAIMEDGRNDVFLSAASAWEITLKAAAGRLEFGMAADR